MYSIIVKEDYWAEHNFLDTRIRTIKDNISSWEEAKKCFNKTELTYYIVAVYLKKGDEVFWVKGNLKRI